jgi:hypothetical protein
MKRWMSVFAAAAVAASSAMVFAVPEAQAVSSKTWCDPGSSTSGGHCVTVSNPKHHEKTLDTVPIRNKSKKITTHNTCEWSDSVTVSLSLGYKAGASVEATVYKLAKAQVNVELSYQLSMSATTARRIAGDFTLKPGQSLYCHRTFGYYTYDVEVTDWGSDHKLRTKTTTATVPYTLGALFTDK